MNTIKIFIFVALSTFAFGTYNVNAMYGLSTDEKTDFGDTPTIFNPNDLNNNCIAEGIAFHPVTEAVIDFTHKATTKGCNQLVKDNLYWPIQKNTQFNWEKFFCKKVPKVINKIGTKFIEEETWPLLKKLLPHSTAYLESEKKLFDLIEEKSKKSHQICSETEAGFYEKMRKSKKTKV